MIFLEPQSTFNRAILGVVYKSSNEPSICYSADQVVNALVEVEGYEYDAADKWYNDHIQPLEDDEGGPVFVYQSDDNMILPIDLKDYR